MEVDSDFIYDNKYIGWTKSSKPFLFPYRFKIKIINEGRMAVKFSTVEASEKANHTNPNEIDNIVFIADKGKTWNIYLQVSIVAIPKEDFEYISARLKEGFKSSR